MTLIDISQKYMKFSVRQSNFGYIGPVLRPVPAIRYIADCLEAGHTLVGLSGFHYFDDGKMQPDQLFEVDAGEFETSEEFLGRIGGLILSQIGSNVVFEIAFEL